MAGEESKWIGRRLADGRYQIVSKLGAGGMAVVYKARDSKLGHDVVVKVPHLATMKDQVYAGRFSREIKMLVDFYHPHIVTITDHGEIEGHPFAVMNYLGGGSLREIEKATVHQHPNWQIRNLRTWLTDIADALDFIHEKNYVHRDVKPENILFDENENVYLSDFGIAKALAEKPSENKPTVLPTSQFGVMLGTPQYSAPEIMQEMPCTASADQYGLAMIVYEYFVGRHPYAKLSAVEIYRRMMSTELPRLNAVAPWVSPSVADQVHRGLARDPKRRFVDCKAFAASVITQIQNTMPNVLMDQPASIAPDHKDLSCPTCFGVLRVSSERKQKRVRCPHCNALLFVPADMAVLQAASDRVASGPPMAPSTLRPPSNPSVDIDTPGGQASVATPADPPPPPSQKKRGTVMRFLRGKKARLVFGSLAAVALVLVFIFVVAPWLFSSSITQENVVIGQITITHADRSVQTNLGVVLPSEQHVRYFGTITRDGSRWKVGIACSHTQFRNRNELERSGKNEKKKHFAMLDGEIVQSGEYFLFPQLKRENALGKSEPFDGLIRRTWHHDVDGQVVDDGKVKEASSSYRRLLEFRKLYFPRDDKLQLSDAFFHGTMLHDVGKKSWRPKELFLVTKNGVEKIEGKMAPFEPTVFSLVRNDDDGNQTVIGTTTINVHLSFTPATSDSVKGIPFLDRRKSVASAVKSYLKGTIEWREMGNWDLNGGEKQNVSLTHTEVVFHLDAERSTKDQIHHTTNLLMFLAGPMVETTSMQVQGPLAKAE